MLQVSDKQASSAADMIYSKNWRRYYSNQTKPSANSTLTEAGTMCTSASGRHL